jgi:GNAT superfamily N-acetyltransferase
MNTVQITYLEMRSPAALLPKRGSDPRFAIREATVKQWQFNRFLYALVGAAWSWTDKQAWSDQHWADYVASDSLRTFVGYYDGSIAGYYELQHQVREVEIVYFGLAPQFIGRGLGGILLTSALEIAWTMNPNRVWVHTCTLDHPAAVPNYQARGMTIYKVETAPDNHSDAAVLP